MKVEHILEIDKFFCTIRNLKSKSTIIFYYEFNLYPLFV